MRRWHRRLRRRLRPLLRLSLALSLLLLVLLVLAAARLPGIRGDLEQARAGLTSAQRAVSDGDPASARRDVAAAVDHARSAADTTDNRIWRVLRRLPVLGAPFEELAAVADVTAMTAERVAAPLTDLRPMSSSWQGRLDLEAITATQPVLRSADAALATAAARLAAAPHSRLGPLTSARSELTRELNQLGATVSGARLAADVVPQLAGGDRQRRYFVAIQNPAEARATGGLLGAFAVLRADNGRLSLEHVGSNDELEDPAASVIDLGEEYDRRYGRLGGTRGWRSANLTPDVPTVARTLTALWRHRTGEAVDGVVLVDPFTLALLLQVTGPVTLPDGTRLDAENAVQELTIDVYRRFPRTADAQRNDYLAQTARLVFARLQQPGLDARRLMDKMGDAVTSGHLNLWSAQESVQQKLQSAAVGGALPGIAPYLRVVVQDAGGSKLGSYLRQDVDYAASPTGEAVDLGAGPQPEEEGTIQVTLANTAPAGLPEYVTLRADAPDGRPRPVGQIRTWTSVYLGPRATLLAATLDGRPVALQADTERGHAVFSTFLSVDPGGTARLVLTVRQPTAPPP